MQRLVAHNWSVKMELTMSMFATRADYWKARADLAEQTMYETAEALGCKPDNEAMLVAAKNAERYRWLRANWARIVTDTVWAGVDEPRGVKAIELGAETLGSVDSDSLDRAFDRCMAESVLHNV